jgi:hypothetical protein
VPKLSAAVCSIAPTRRRRFLWAAWWTAAPSRDPFQKPDAFGGGARTREEALQEAVRFAGRPLHEIESRWARAWGRILVGQPPWAGKGYEPGEVRPAQRAAGVPPTRPQASVWSILGISPDATVAEIKSAFKLRALETHPDRGGSAESFRLVLRAYEEAQRRIARPRKRRTPA